MKLNNERPLATKIIYDVVFKKENLKNLLSKQTQDHPKANSIKNLCYQTIRHYGSLEKNWLNAVSKKPKDKIVQVVLTQALCEKYVLGHPDHAIVNESLKSLKKLNKRWALSLVNATLRSVFALKEIKLNPEDSHPAWWQQKIKQEWPDFYDQIIKNNTVQAPMWVRANLKKIDEISSEWQSHDEIPSAYIIKASDVSEVSGFSSGDLSIQDASAQLAAYILNPQDGDKILDACAAPGGKTGHLLELSNNLQVTAIEKHANRAKKISQNLERIKQKAQIKVADATNLSEWFDGELFDKVLLDVPCSASGILRRQPDIKFHRNDEIFKNTCADQYQILKTMASVVKKKGLILYVTCSIFSEENHHQIERFLQENKNFKETQLKYSFAQTCKYGIQILPGTDNMDGFYYCLLEKVN